MIRYVDGTQGLQPVSNIRYIVGVGLFHIKK